MQPQRPQTRGVSGGARRKVSLGLQLGTCIQGLWLSACADLASARPSATSISTRQLYPFPLPTDTTSQSAPYRHLHAITSVQVLLHLTRTGLKAFLQAIMTDARASCACIYRIRVVDFGWASRKDDFSLRGLAPAEPKQSIAIDALALGELRTHLGSLAGWPLPPLVE